MRTPLLITPATMTASSHRPRVPLNGRRPMCRDRPAADYAAIPSASFVAQVTWRSPVQFMLCKLPIGR
eukprot:4283998-Pyramimonas_sp.AAC.1